MAGDLVGTEHPLLRTVSFREIKVGESLLVEHALEAAPQEQGAYRPLSVLGVEAKVGIEKGRASYGTVKIGRRASAVEEEIPADFIALGRGGHVGQEVLPLGQPEIPPPLLVGAHRDRPSVTIKVLHLKRERVAAEGDLTATVCGEFLELSPNGATRLGGELILIVEK